MNEPYVDWSIVPEVQANRQLMQWLRTAADPRFVHYEDEARRASELRRSSYREFTRNASGFRRSRFVEFVDNQRHNRNWLAEYAWFMAEREPAAASLASRKDTTESLGYSNGAPFRSRLPS
ncbi:MAG: hypothetical protein JW751_20425 [Polyangiaceae bacterium]|nr:hypothetical protein [Polyangiaceae bacterium]